jgi:hypothetical protein
VGVLWLLRWCSARFQGWRLSDRRTWREGVLSLKHRRCNETKKYHSAQQSVHEKDWLPGNENPHARTSGDEERLTIAVIMLRKPQTFHEHLAAFLLSGVASARRTATPGNTCCPVHGSVRFKSYSTQEGRPLVKVPAIRRTQKPRLTERTQRCRDSHRFSFFTYNGLGFPWFFVHKGTTADGVRQSTAGRLKHNRSSFFPFVSGLTERVSRLRRLPSARAKVRSRNRAGARVYRTK